MSGLVSRSVEAYAEASISSGTTASYRSAWRNWEEHCKERKWGIWEQFTPERIADWLAALADGGRHCAATIRAYKSALSTWHIGRAGPRDQGPNPAQHPYVTRVLDGIQRHKAPHEQAKRLAAPPPANAIDPQWIASELVPRHPPGNPRLAMRLAAIALGSAGAMRPSEYMGSAHHPERAPTRDQLTFFDGNDERRGERHPGDNGPVPAQARYLLRVSKTDQHHRGTSKTIAAGFAVTALWNWCLAHGPWAQPSDPLFALNGKLLLPAQLMAHVASELKATGRDPAGTTLKGTRRGAASALLTAGASTADIQVAGHWKGASSQQHYFTKEARRAHAARVNRSLDAASSSSSQ